jgi:hypothetical protein
VIWSCSAGIASDAADSVGASVRLSDQYAIVSGGGAQLDRAAPHVRVSTDAVQIVAISSSEQSSEVCLTLYAKFLNDYGVYFTMSQ